MKRAFVLALALAMALVFAAPVFSAISNPVARVNLTKTRVIYQNELDETLAAYKTEYGDSVDSATVLDAMISDEILAQAMERDGYVLTDEQKNELLASQRANIEAQVGQALTDEQFEYVVSTNLGVTVEYYKEYLAQQYLVQNYVMSMKTEYFTDDVLAPTTADVESFYKKNRSSFISSENIKLSHIFFNFGDDKAAALKKATDVLNLIKGGKITFEKAVSQYSEDEGSVASAGEIGWLTISDSETMAYMGESFFDAVFALDAGEISDVVESLAGYHIVKVTVHNDTRILGIDDKIAPTDTTTVRNYITDYLTSQKLNTQYQQAYMALLVDLKSQASIKYLTN